MALKKTALFIGAPQYQSHRLADRFGEKCHAINVATPRHAVRAIQTIRFDYVVISLDRVEEIEYMALMSIIRRIAPYLSVMCVPVKIVGHVLP